MLNSVVKGFGCLSSGLMQSSETIEGPVFNRSLETVYKLSANAAVEEAELEMIATLPDKEGVFANVLVHYLQEIEGDPIFGVLDLPLRPGETLASAFRDLRTRTIKVSKVCVKFRVMH